MGIRKTHFPLVLAIITLLAGTAFAASSSTKHYSSTQKPTASAQKRSSSTHKTASHSSKRSGKGKKTTAKSRGQRTIGEERTREIQTALIREHYLSGEPTGVWDQGTKDALVKLQADNGWQTKVTPDSRALIKLGLGPDHKGLLNPDTAAVSTPHELAADHDSIPGGSAQQP